MLETKNKRSLTAGFMLFLILLVPFSSAASSSTFGYSSSSSKLQDYKPNTFGSYSQQQAYNYWPILEESDKCEATVDFMMFVRPGGCSPDVVRSDLLEEQNVPVFCKVDIIKLNPLVDISQIKSVKFTTRERNDYVVDVSFHPNREAIKMARGFGKPLINDAGYVVILLKRQESEEKMPGSVKVNITGVLRFDLENLVGAGKNNYYLEIVDDAYWNQEDNYKENGFWKGKGYLRADWVDGSKAGISIYRDKDEKLVSFSLEKGKISQTYYMPGFYCKAGLQVKLDDVKAAEEKVQLEVDGEKIWLVEGERFLDNECLVVKIDVGEEKKDNGKAERENSVKINCRGKIKELSYVEEKVNDVWQRKKIEEVQDGEISKEVKENFDKAKEYANEVKGEYGAASEGEGVYKKIFGAQALYELAVLAEKIGLKAEARELFLEVMEKYPDTSYSESSKGELFKIYSGVEGVDYKEHYIRLIEIKKPTKEEASADFVVWKVEDGKQVNQNLRKEEKGIQEKDSFFDADGKKKFKLIRLERGKLILEYEGNSFDLEEGESKFLPENCEEDKNKKCEYKIYLGNINLEEIAKVSLISKMPNEYSESNFSVEIGIEKRAIKLSPDKAQEMIDNLEESIKKWETTVENLGKVVKGMKAGCLATSAYLLAKNFFANLGGGATARQDIMPVYYKICKDEALGDEAKFNACLNRENSNIKKDIEAYQKIIEPLNEKIIGIQKANKDKAGYVNREKVVSELRKNYPDAFTGLDDARLSKISIEQARDLIEVNMIENSDATQNLKKEATAKKNKIIEDIKGIAEGKAGGGIYTGEGVWWDKAKVKYYSRGKGEKLVEIVPMPKEYNNKKGFYVHVPDKAYDESGDFDRFYIKNIGKDGYLDKEGDDSVLVNVGDWREDNVPALFDLDTENSRDNTRKLMKDAEQAVKTANDNYGKRSFRLFGETLNVDVRETVAGEKRCTDFMSPGDCSLLFNVCDPVLCPSSRCDLGGNYRVDNVVASGIIGSIALCLPNFGNPSEGKVLVPVCLSGIHAGLDTFLSIMKSHRDCLKERLETGKYLGFCDEVYSLHLCDFFWRQSGIFMDVLLSNFVGSIHGAAMKGGGEYLTVQDSWANLKNTVDFMKNDYAVNAVNAFRARSTGEIGGEFCKMFVSARFPNNKDFFDNLLEPESPTQFYAWFDEMTYSTATVPATSQYKVYYHIFAGKDEGVSYQVYLKSPGESAYVSVQEMIIVDTGFIQRGGYFSSTKDFTAPSGYKELCVRINGKDECGFGKVTTGFALNYLTDKYYEEQAKEKVKTEEDCISGTPSAYSLLQPNIQAGVEEVIQPELEKKGVVRICSTEKPDKQTNPQRWKDVGYCGKESVRCWLDLESVKEVIENKEIEKSVTGEVSGKELRVRIEEGGGVSEEDANNVIGEAKLFVESIKKEEVKDTKINEMINKLEYVRDKVAGDNLKAEAGYYQFKIYATLAEKLWQKEQENKAASVPATPVSTTKKEAEEKKTYKIEKLELLINNNEKLKTAYLNEPIRLIVKHDCDDIRFELVKTGRKILFLPWFDKKINNVQEGNFQIEEKGKYYVEAFCLDASGKILNNAKTDIINVEEKPAEGKTE